MATASGVMGPKQTRGYFVVLSTISTTSQFNIAAGSGAGGSYQPGAITTQSATAPSGVANITANAVLKDMGKTVVSSTHTFRKVQLLVTSGPSITATAAATGLPFYIELNTGQNLQVNSGSSSYVGGAASVAYMPGLF